MGMTIDESRQLLSQYQKLFNSLNGDYKLSQVQISELSHSIGTALDAMCKYQQIEQIVAHWACCGNPSDSMIAISEVIENGNND